MVETSHPQNRIVGEIPSSGHTWMLREKSSPRHIPTNQPQATNEPLTFAAVHLVTKILKLIVRSCVLVKHERAEQKPRWFAFFPHVLAGSLWKVPTNTHKNRKRHKFLPCKHLNPVNLYGTIQHFLTSSLHPKKTCQV